MNLDPTDPATLARVVAFYRLAMPAIAMRDQLPPIALALGTKAATDLVDEYEQAARDENEFDRFLASLEAQLSEDE